MNMRVRVDHCDEFQGFQIEDLDFDIDIDAEHFRETADHQLGLVIRRRGFCEGLDLQGDHDGREHRDKF